MTKKYSLLFLLAIPFFLLNACDSKDFKLDQWSKEEVEFTSIDFHKEVQDYKENKNTENFLTLRNHYPDFAEIYFNHLLPWRAEEDLAKQEEQFNEFLSYEDYSNLVDTVNLFYSKMDKTDAKIKKTLQHIQSLNMGFMIPDTIIYFTSGLNHYYSVIINDHTISIGLDMFLGKNYPHYKNIEPPMPDFMLNKMEEKHIPLWMAQNIYMDRYETRIDGEDFLSAIIQKGKEYFFLELVLPDLEMHEIFGYTKEQMKWAEDNERFIYNHFLQNEMLYSKDPTKILRYITDTYTTPNLAPESPGNIGSFVGWKIVRNFAHQNKDLNLVFSSPEDANYLKQAKYKP